MLFPVPEATHASVNCTSTLLEDSSATAVPCDVRYSGATCRDRRKPMEQVACPISRPFSLYLDWADHFNICLKQVLIVTRSLQLLLECLVASTLGLAAILC